METKIDILRLGTSGNGWTFRVTVTEGNSATEHVVELNADFWRAMTNEKETPESLVERSFRFLLERESKENILQKFELPAISRYFPQYELDISLLR